MRLLTAFLLLLLTFPAAAQKARTEGSGNAGRIRNGLYFGGVGAQIDGDQMSGYHKAGITGGLSSTVQLNSRWNVRLEVGYIQKGSRNRPDTTITQFPDLGANFQSMTSAQQQAYLAQFYQQQPRQWLRYRLNYVQLPVLVEYRGSEKVTAYAGVSFDRLLRATADYGYGYGPPLGSQFRQTDIMGHLGVELGFARRWSATMRLMYSLRDISSDGLGPDRYYFFATGRLGGFRNNLLSTTLRYYLSDRPTFKGQALFRRASDGAAPAPESDADGEPLN